MCTVAPVFGLRFQLSPFEVVVMGWKVRFQQELLCLFRSQVITSCEVGKPKWDVFAVTGDWSGERGRPWGLQVRLWGHRCGGGLRGMNPARAAGLPAPRWWCVGRAFICLARAWGELFPSVSGEVFTEFEKMSWSNPLPPLKRADFSASLCVPFSCCRGPAGTWESSATFPAGPSL